MSIVCLTIHTNVKVAWWTTYCISLTQQQQQKKKNQKRDAYKMYNWKVGLHAIYLFGSICLLFEWCHIKVQSTLNYNVHYIISQCVSFTIPDQHFSFFFFFRWWKNWNYQNWLLYTLLKILLYIYTPTRFFSKLFNV